MGWPSRDELITKFPEQPPRTKLSRVLYAFASFTARPAGSIAAMWVVGVVMAAFEMLRWFQTSSTVHAVATLACVLLALYLAYRYVHEVGR